MYNILGEFEIRPRKPLAQMNTYNKRQRHGSQFFFLERQANLTY